VIKGCRERGGTLKGTGEGDRERTKGHRLLKKKNGEGGGYLVKGAFMSLMHGGGGRVRTDRGGLGENLRTRGVTQKWRKSRAV